MNPKVLVGCPTYDGKAYCFNAYAEAVLNLDYDNYDILLVDNSRTEDYLNRIKEKLPSIRTRRFETPKETLAEARNVLREKFLEGDYDYLLSLEQDIIPPADVIQNLLSSKKDIIAGHYIVPMKIDGKLGAVSTVLIKNKDKLITLPRELSETKEIMEIEACGLGILLISRKVLENVKFRTEKESKAWDDMFFSKDAKKEGFKIFLDPTIKCKHLIDKKRMQ